MDTYTRIQTRQTTRQQLIDELAAFKTDNIDLQIRVEEQRREIALLKSQLRKSKSKSALYRSVLALTVNTL